MRNHRTRLIFAAALPLLTINCSENPSGPDTPKPAHVITAIASNTRHPLVKQIIVDLDSASSIEITYTDGSGGQLRVSDAAAVSHHELQLTRLRSKTTYTFQARARSGTGELGEPVGGTFTTDTLPKLVDDLSFTAQGHPTMPVTLAQVSASSNGWFGMVALDSVGRVIWYHRTKTGSMGFLRRPDGTIAIIDEGIVIVDATGDTVASLAAKSGGTYGNIHHAMASTGDGAILFTATETKVISDTTVTGDAIWEWNPRSGVVTKRWSAFSFFDWKTERTSASGPSDWLHANALWVGARGNVLLSMRNMNQVASISADWKAVEWRLGGPGATITLPASDQFFGQHGVKELTNGRLLLFDNGFDRPAGSTFSRAMEIAIDDVAKTASKVWEYRGAPDIYSLRLGSVHRYSSGNTLIDFGWQNPDPIQIIEVTSTGALQWMLTPANDILGKIYAVDPLSTLFGERQ